jgi:hypothetical protein
MKSISKFKLLTLNSANFFCGLVGWKLQRNLPDYVLHKYSSYEEYRDTQIKWNITKLNRVWADPQVLDVVIDRVNRECQKSDLFGLCHGSRNGFEQNYLLQSLQGQITGTDISETATSYPNSVVHDFHNVNPKWVSRADFIYSNSLDQSWNPQAALDVWVDQLRVGGLLFIEMSEAGSPRHASKMDPFGVKPEYFAYLLAMWLGHKVSVEVLHTEKSKWKMPIWLYEIKRIR